MQPPVAWQTADGVDSCCAVLCPSTRALRAQLREHAVPFEMPAAGVPPLRLEPWPFSGARGRFAPGAVAD
eukprot:6939907-Prymnesium_polylepis.1